MERAQEPSDLGRVRAVEPADVGRAVFFLRSMQGLQQADLAKLMGMTQSAVSNLERGIGKRPPSLADLDQASAALRLAPSAGRRTLAFLGWLRADAAAMERSPSLYRSSGPAGAAFDRGLDLARAVDGLLDAGLRAAMLQEPPGGPQPAAAAEARRHAGELWARLAAYEPKIRRILVEEGGEFQSWALCELVCAESERVAADSADRAVDLAELALQIARLVPGGAGWRARNEGYAGARLGNALRVGGNHPEAEQAFAPALRLWQAGAASDPGILNAVKVLDLEASLRMAQGKFARALDLLDRALATGPEPVVAGRLLLNKANALEKLGQNEAALEILRQAAPLVAVAEETRLLHVQRFNVVVNLCALGRHAEAEPLLAEVREIAERRDQKLDRVRLRWLEARVAAGLGRTAEATRGLESVQREFADFGIAYDAALVTLELAVLLLDHGRTTEVRRLAEESKCIFDAQGGHREALATLGVFRKAAAREVLTAALARHLLDALQSQERTDDE